MGEDEHVGFVVYHKVHGFMVEHVGFVVYHKVHGFMVDNCAGGAWTEDRREAHVFDAAHLASESFAVLEPMGMDADDVVILQWITLG